MTANLTQLYVSGSVQRYHTNPVLASTGQTNADHQGRCVQLLFALHPEPSIALIRAMATHDVGELIAGDLSGPFKRDNPEFAEEHRAIEDAARRKITGWDDDLTDEDLRWMRMIDRLESLLWCILKAPHEYYRPAAKWWPQREAVLTMARELGVGDRVFALISDMEDGKW